MSISFISWFLTMYRKRQTHLKAATCQNHKTMRLPYSPGREGLATSKRVKTKHWFSNCTILASLSLCLSLCVYVCAHVYVCILNTEISMNDLESESILCIIWFYPEVHDKAITPTKNWKFVYPLQILQYWLFWKDSF